MNKLFSAMLVLAFATLFNLSVTAADTEQSPSSTDQQRELIYCADLMTHEERVAYRARMHAASTPQERSKIRQTHKEEMQARARERGLNPIECVPLRQRERLRLRGDKP
ncbi:MAG TPA: hypothetical protein VIQ03_07195 [Gammaproteobacteria bacterium]